MSHAVRFRDVTGAVQLEDVASLEEALERVERLRNRDDATEVRVFREIPIELRTYYKAVAVDEPAVAGGAPADPPGDEAGEEAGERAAAEAASAPPSTPPPGVPVEPPSGAMVMSRPPAAAAAESPARAAEPAADAPEPEHRRQLFSRS